MNKMFTVVVVIAFSVAVGCQSAPDEQAGQDQQADDQSAEQQLEDESVGGADEQAVAQQTETQQADEQEEESDDEESIEELFPEPDNQEGATDWRESEHEIPQRLADPDAGDGAEDPEALLAEVSAGWRGDDTETRLLQQDEDRAIGVVLSWGWKDDSVYGGDLRVEMRMRDDAWYVERLKERVHCRRGVSNGEVCV